MLIVFHSKASSDVVMLEPVAKSVLDIIGAHVAHGYLEGAQLDSAIAKLESAVTLDKHKKPVKPIQEKPKDDDDDDWVERPKNKPVELYQRIYPLLQMFKLASAENVPVYWGELPSQAL